MATKKRLVMFAGTTFVWTVDDESIAETDEIYMNIKQELSDETYLLETSSVDGEWVVGDGTATLTLSAEATAALGAVEAGDYSVYKVSTSDVRDVLYYGEVYVYDHATLGAV